MSSMTTVSKSATRKLDTQTKHTRKNMKLHFKLTNMSTFYLMVCILTFLSVLCQTRALVKPRSDINSQHQDPDRWCWWSNGYRKRNGGLNIVSRFAVRWLTRKGRKNRDGKGARGGIKYMYGIVKGKAGRVLPVLPGQSHFGNQYVDLTYVTNRIVAMGKPTEYKNSPLRKFTGVGKLDRSSSKDLRIAFRLSHPFNGLGQGNKTLDQKLCPNQQSPKVLIVNLQEKNESFGYDFDKDFQQKKKFGIEYEHKTCRFPDHGLPTFKQLIDIIADVNKWMHTEENKTGIVAVHCRAGKARTGLVISALLMRQLHDRNMSTQLWYQADRFHETELVERRRYANRSKKNLKEAFLRLPFDVENDQTSRNNRRYYADQPAACSIQSNVSDMKKIFSFYGQIRTRDGNGCRRPGQRRYAYYYGQYLFIGYTQTRKWRVKKIIVSGDFTSNSIKITQREARNSENEGNPDVSKTVSFRNMDNNVKKMKQFSQITEDLELTGDSKRFLKMSPDDVDQAKNISKSKMATTFDIKEGIPLCGDASIKFNSGGSKTFNFNTNFFPNTNATEYKHTVHYSQLDGKISTESLNPGDQYERIEFVFEKVPARFRSKSTTGTLCTRTGKRPFTSNKIGRGLRGRSDPGCRPPIIEKKVDEEKVEEENPVRRRSSTTSTDGRCRKATFEAYMRSGSVVSNVGKSGRRSTISVGNRNTRGRRRSRNSRRASKKVHTRKPTSSMTHRTSTNSVPKSAHTHA